ncbi:MAG: DNA methyltransferase [Candidatus Binatia bacterium]
MHSRNQIIEGDCNAALESIPRHSVDLVVTDPPYLVSYRDRSGRTIKNDDSPETVLASFPQLYRVLKPDSFCICFYGWNRIDTFFSAWKDAGFKPVGHLVWQKDYASRTGFLKSCHEQAYLLAKGRPCKPTEPLGDVQPWEYTGNRSHPTENAVSILKPLIESFSQPGDLVLDPFAGSGSTLVAAALAGRDYLGIELEAGYCELARRRLSGATRYLQRRNSAAARECTSIAA